MSDKKLDQFAESVFTELGCEIDDVLIETYTNFKRTKDFLQPGRLTAEGYAIIVSLADIKRGDSPKKTVKKAPSKKQTEPEPEFDPEAESPFKE